MLAVTDRSISAIRDLTDAPGVPAGAGLRIASDPDDGALTVWLAAGPAPGDEVLSFPGAQVFLEDTTAPLLSDMTLDVTADNGQVQFVLEEELP